MAAMIVLPMTQSYRQPKSIRQLQLQLQHLQLQHPKPQLQQLQLQPRQLPTMPLQEKLPMLALQVPVAEGLTMTAGAVEMTAPR